MQLLISAVLTIALFIALVVVLSTVTLLGSVELLLLAAFSVGIVVAVRARRRSTQREGSVT